MLEKKPLLMLFQVQQQHLWSLLLFTGHHHKSLHSLVLLLLILVCLPLYSNAWLSGQYIEQLKSLQELRESGVLSEEEFEEQKTFALQNTRFNNCSCNLSTRPKEALCEAHTWYGITVYHVIQHRSSRWTCMQGLGVPNRWNGIWNGLWNGRSKLEKAVL